MDSYESSADRDADDAIERPASIGLDERRMHVRAYNHWASLLRGRLYPTIDDIDAARLGDFGPHGVVLDFSRDPANPSLPFIGAALREECAIEGAIGTIADVPSRSLLSRLTDHYLEIIANRAPIGFEAEFTGRRGHNTMYRGILMPLSSDGSTIDNIYGVINWKELADAETTAALVVEVDRALAQRPTVASMIPVWADSPGSKALPEEYVPPAETAVAAAPGPNATLGERLDHARRVAAAANGALVAAIAETYDLALIAEDDPAWPRLLALAGITPGATASVEDVVRAVFGADGDRSSVATCRAAIDHAMRQHVPDGAFRDFVANVDGGLAGVLAARRADRRARGRAA